MTRATDKAASEAIRPLDMDLDGPPQADPATAQPAEEPASAGPSPHALFDAAGRVRRQGRSAPKPLKLQLREEKAEVKRLRRLLRQREEMILALNSGEGGQERCLVLTWQGRGAITLADWRKLATAAGMPEAWHAKAKSPAVQMGRAAQTIAGRSQLTARAILKSSLTSPEAKEDAKTWKCLWKMLDMHDSETLTPGQYGDKTVCLVGIDNDGKPFLRYQEADARAQAVATDIENEWLRLTATDILIAADLTDWISSYIQEELGGEQVGKNHYTPSCAHADTMRLQAAVTEHWVRMTAYSCETAGGILDDLQAVLLRDIARLTKELADAHADRNRNREPGEPERPVTQPRAQGLLDRLALITGNDDTSRLGRHRGVLGKERTRAITRASRKLSRQLEALAPERALEMD